MTPGQLRSVYISNRASKSVAEAALATMKQCSIPASLLLDVFNAGVLDGNEDLKTMHSIRNELLSHFKELEKAKEG